MRICLNIQFFLSYATDLGKHFYDDKRNHIPNIEILLTAGI